VKRCSNLFGPGKNAVAWGEKRVYLSKGGRGNNIGRGRGGLSTMQKKGRVSRIQIRAIQGEIGAMEGAKVFGKRKEPLEEDHVFLG